MFHYTNTRFGSNGQLLMMKSGVWNTIYVHKNAAGGRVDSYETIIIITENVIIIITSPLKSSRNSPHISNTRMKKTEKPFSSSFFFNPHLGQISVGLMVICIKCELIVILKSYVLLYVLQTIPRDVTIRI